MSFVCMTWCSVKKNSGSTELFKVFLTAASFLNLLEFGLLNLVLLTQV